MTKLRYDWNHHPDGVFERHLVSSLLNLLPNGKRDGFQSETQTECIALVRGKQVMKSVPVVVKPIDEIRFLGHHQNLLNANARVEDLFVMFDDLVEEMSENFEHPGVAEVVFTVQIVPLDETVDIGGIYQQAVFDLVDFEKTKSRRVLAKADMGC